MTVITSCNTTKQITKVDSQKVNPEHEVFSSEIAHQILTGMNTGDYITLNENIAADAMVRGFTYEVQQNAAFQISMNFGEYAGPGELVEILYDRKANLFIYRYRGDFESKADPEVRVVLNEDGKLAGFFVLGWRDNLQ